MALSKKKLFDNLEQDLSRVGKALSHPARVHIMKYLLQNGQQTCQMIVDNLPLSQSTVSQHLRELRTASLIHGKKEGTKVLYSARPEKLQEFYKALGDHFALLKKGQQSLF